MQHRICITKCNSGVRAHCMLTCTLCHEQRKVCPPGNLQTIAWHHHQMSIWGLHTDVN